MPFTSGLPAPEALNAKIIYFSLITCCANRATSGTSWGLREKDGRNKQRKRGKAIGDFIPRYLVPGTNELSGIPLGGTSSWNQQGN